LARIDQRCTDLPSAMQWCIGRRRADELPWLANDRPVRIRHRGRAFGLALSSSRDETSDEGGNGKHRHRPTRKC